MKIKVIQHIAIETPGKIEDILKDKGFEFDFIRPFLGDKIPQSTEDEVALLFMGGPMGVYETSNYPFLIDEMRLIEHAMREEKGVLGICLGSQLIAQVLGSEVKRGDKEIGWYDVDWTKEALESSLINQGVSQKFKALLWHGDIFSCPKSAVNLAKTELTECQGFLHNENILGLLFHLETTEFILTNMIEEFREELSEFGEDGGRIVRDMSKYSFAMHSVLEEILNNWINNLKV